MATILLPEFLLQESLAKVEGKLWELCARFFRFVRFTLF